jgi:SAM-dependent methyltransferase
MYSTRSPDSVSWYQESPTVSLRLIEKSLAAPATILDVGGGTSNLVDLLIERRYRVGVLDISDTALNLTRARLGARASDVSWFVANVTQFRSPETWDIWHDRAVFHFLIDAGDRASYVAALDAATGPGSVVIIATFGPEGPERCSGLPARRYSPADLQAELGPRYELLDVEWEMHTTPGGTAQQFVYCRFRREDDGS